MDIESLQNISPVILALIATTINWGFTALGAAMVFFFKSINKVIMNALLGFAAGIMIAASFFSLLLPAIEMQRETGSVAWIPAVIGFLAGGTFLYLIDKTLPHLHLSLKTDEAEGIRTSWQRSVLLILAITIHNIPEGLAVGVAFGAVSEYVSLAALGSVLALSFGIGIQDIPEGAAISFPLRREGFSRMRAFWYGQLSGIVEPIGGVIGASLVLFVKPILPYALSFAAGAMIFVVVEELIPESQSGSSTDVSTIGALIGFALMMFLDVALS